MMIRYFTLLATCLIPLASTPAIAESKIWGLVIGINEYDTQRDLLGARNDATDIAETLIEYQDATVFRLLDHEASRIQIEETWKLILRSAAPGDTVVFSYAGHGQQEVDLNGDEGLDDPRDRMDEVFLLSGFNAQTDEGRGERIVDDEIARWFAQAEDLGINVLFLADSCYSGTMTRQARSTRIADPYEVTVADAPLAATEKPSTAIPTNVTFISGSLETEQVPEVSIGGEMRGAASYAFARALSGAADLDRNGTVTRGELAEYMLTVSTMHGSQATPDIAPRDGYDTPLLASDGERPDEIEIDAVELATSSGTGIDGVTPSDAPFGEAPLNWDEASGNVLSAEGDVLAYGAGAGDIPSIVDKYTLIEVLKRQGSAAPLAIGIIDGQRPFRVGDTTQITIPSTRFPYLTVFSINNRGATELLFPIATRPEDIDGRAQRIGVEFFVRITADGLGEERIVAVSTANPPGALRTALRRGASPGVLAKLVERLGLRLDAQVGIAAILTKDD